FLCGLSGIALTQFVNASASEDAFTALMDQLDRDPALVENAWALREVQTTRAQRRGLPSQRQLPAIATDMIVRLEVSNSARYERLYRRPIWPGGQSGVTIGIGYDLRFASEDDLNNDWSALLDPAMVATLRPVL